MIFHRIGLALAVAAGLTLNACEQKPASDLPNGQTAAKVLATVNGETITDKDYEHYLQLRQARQEPVADKNNEKKVVLDEMIDRVLLTQHATADGVDRDPEVALLLKRVRENIMMQAMVRKILKDSPVTDAELKTRFEQEVANTHKTEYLVRHILVKDEDDARDLIKRLQGKANFAALAKKESVDIQSGKKGGSIGWVNQGSAPAEFFQGVTRIEKGAISTEPVKTDFGWHVIKVEDTRTATIPTFEQFMADKQARANLHRKLQDEKIEKLVKDLRAKAKTTMN